MIVHAIVDYSYLYFKYKFMLDSGRMTRLTAPLNWKGTVIEKDISQIYYSIKEIEGFRRKLEEVGHSVFVSICFDMPSGRKTGECLDGADGLVGEQTEAVKKYKSNRTTKLKEEDFENIQLVENILSQAGYNTYRFEQCEADDLVYYLVKNYKYAFDYTVIYTPDLDLMINIDKNVGASRFKSTSGYSSIDYNNFSSYLGAELKCTMPYNGLLLFKSTVGDKSDCIDGIKKFGVKAFDKLVNHLNTKSIDWERMSDWRYTEEIIRSLADEGYFNQVQLNQALESLSLVRPREIEENSLPQPIKKSTYDLRQDAYTPYRMRSLIN